jgi:hypothetical protein
LPNISQLFFARYLGVMCHSTIKWRIKLQLNYVTGSDQGKVEGGPEVIMPLYNAIKQTCSSGDADFLWELILEKYELGVANTNSWVVNMNAAIHLWNTHQPTCAKTVKSTFNVD